MITLNKLAPAVLVAMSCAAGAPGAWVAAEETLSARQKAIIPIAAFTATGNLPKLDTALVEGLAAGLTVNEIKEILIQTYAYAGFPRALNGLEAFMAVIAKRKERGITDKTGKEATPMAPDLDRAAYGHQVRNSLVGSDISKRTGGYPVFAPAIDQFLVEHLFADIFYRDVLSQQERELATISILSAMAGTEAQLKAHLGIAMRVGFREAQIEDFVAALEQSVDGESAERAAATLKSLLGIVAPVRKEPLKMIKKGNPVKGPANHFTGNVTVGSGFSPQLTRGYGGAMVNFEAGARTAWHTHPFGQTLVVISGRGRVQSEGEAIQEILPGDIVWIPANTRHWHGAAPKSAMSHVAISAPRNGETVEWLKQVSDAEYEGKAARK